MPAPGLDVVSIVETLLNHEVQFVVVGGFALELWDVAVPPTVDVDVTPERSVENLDRLANALNALGAEIRYSGESVSVPGWAHSGTHRTDVSSQPHNWSRSR